MRIDFEERPRGVTPAEIRKAGAFFCLDQLCFVVGPEVVVLMRDEPLRISPRSIEEYASDPGTVLPHPGQQVVITF